jgi:hydrogenase maturation protease
VKVLVLGYGNRSRNDDGVGWFVVEQLGIMQLADVELQFAHQLEVDHADEIRRFDTVIFVDAAVPQSSHLVTRTVVSPRLQGHAVAHYLTPADVLALCSSLYGIQPHATLFSVRGEDFNFGTALSPATKRGAQEVVRQVAGLVNQMRQQEPGVAGSRAGHA